MRRGLPGPQSGRGGRGKGSPGVSAEARGRVGGRGPQEAAGSLLSHPASVGQKRVSAPGAKGPPGKLRLKILLLPRRTVIFGK